MSKNKKPEELKNDGVQSGLVHIDTQHEEQAPEDIGSHLNKETGVINWAELVRHFARGVVLNVTTQLDLIDVAACLARDDTVQLQLWLDKGLLRRASDDDARDWTNREPEFWCVVTAPWVLVQERKAEDEHSDSSKTPPAIH